MTLAECEDVRRIPTHFIVKAGHVYRHFERVVKTTEDYAVVEKVGEAGKQAVRLDQRRTLKSVYPLPEYGRILQDERRQVRALRLRERLLHELLVPVVLINNDVAVGFFNDELDSLRLVTRRYRETVALAIDAFHTLLEITTRLSHPSAPHSH